MRRSEIKWQLAGLKETDVIASVLLDMFGSLPNLFSNFYNYIFSTAFSAEAVNGNYNKMERLTVRGVYIPPALTPKRA